MVERGKIDTPNTNTAHFRTWYRHFNEMLRGKTSIMALNIPSSEKMWSIK